MLFHLFKKNSASLILVYPILFFTNSRRYPATRTRDCAKVLRFDAHMSRYACASQTSLSVGIWGSNRPPSVYSKSMIEKMCFREYGVRTSKSKVLNSRASREIRMVTRTVTKILSLTYLHSFYFFVLDFRYPSLELRRAQNGERWLQFWSLWLRFRRPIHSWSNHHLHVP